MPPWYSSTRSSVQQYAVCAWQMAGKTGRPDYCTCTVKLNELRIRVGCFLPFAFFWPKALRRPIHSGFRAPWMLGFPAGFVHITVAVYRSNVTDHLYREPCYCCCTLNPPYLSRSVSLSVGGCGCGCVSAVCALCLSVSLSVSASLACWCNH